MFVPGGSDVRLAIPRITGVIAALLLQAAMPATMAAAPDHQDVVVTGVPLSELKRSLNECLSIGCAPREDIARSLAYAKGQFVAGDYEGSRRTLGAARHRNGRYAASLPIEVSNLHRVDGTMSGLSGLLDAERTTLFDMLDALKAGLPSGDERILLGRLEIADTYARNGRIDDALARYDEIDRRASDASAPIVRAIAKFHRAVLLSAAAYSYPAFIEGARIAQRDIERTTDPALAPFRNGARLLSVGNIRDADERRAALQAGLARMEPVALDRPLLVYAPRIDLEPDQFGAANGTETLWIDLRYTVLPSGKVADVHPVGRSNEFDQRWADALTTMLSRRRYMPMLLPGGVEGTEKVERFSFVSDVKMDTGSHVMTRSPSRRIVATDLSAGVRL